MADKPDVNWAHLQSQFFSEHPPTREFFELHLGAFPWNEEVLPVYAWEDQVFIAAANPDAIQNMMSAWPAHWVLVKADPEPLKSLWAEWNAGDVGVSESNPFDSEPRSMSFEDSTQPRIPFESDEVTRAPVEMPKLPLEERNAASEAAHPVPPGMHNLEQTPPPQAPLPDYQPDSAAATPPEVPSEFSAEDFFQQAEAASTGSGVVATAAEGALDLTGGFPEVAEEAPTSEDEGLTPAVDEIEMVGAPEGFDADHASVSGVRPQVSAESDDAGNFESLSNAGTFSSPKVSLPNLRKDGADTVASAGPKIPTQVPTAKAGAPPPEVSRMSKAEPPPAAAERGRPKSAPPNAPQPVAPQPVAAQPVAASKKAPPVDVAAKPAVAEEAVAETTATFHGLKVTAETKALLTKLPECFTGALLASKAGNSLRIIAASRPEMAAAGAEKDFSLGTPSPFRIVTRTEKPYHGYLINSPYLDTFFQAWNGGKYPEHLTIAPLQSGGNILGFVIAFGTAEANKKSALLSVEKLAQDLLRNWPAAPAAPAKSGGKSTKAG